MSLSTFKRIRKCALLPVAASLVALAQGCVQDGRSTTLDPAPDPESLGVPRAEAPFSAGATATPPPVTPPAAAPATAPAADRPVVAIDNFNFNPPTLTVPVGSAVTWVNRDDVPHTVTANDHSFDSKGMDTDDRYSRTFAVAGTYPYFCAVHPHMTGTVIVK